MIPPTGPGLGVELDEAVALAHPTAETHLHLEAAAGRASRRRDRRVNARLHRPRQPRPPPRRAPARGGLSADGARPRCGRRRRRLVAAGASAGGLAAGRRRGLGLRDHVPAVAGRRQRASSRAPSGVLEGLRARRDLDRHEHERPARARAPRGAGRGARRRDARMPGHGRRPQGRRGRRSPCIAGGDAAVFEAHRALLEAMGGPVIHVGPLGKASVIKVDHEHARVHPPRGRRRGADARQARRRAARDRLRGDPRELGQLVRPRDGEPGDPQRLLRHRLHDGPRRSRTSGFALRPRTRARRPARARRRSSRQTFARAREEYGGSGAGRARS